MMRRTVRAQRVAKTPSWGVTASFVLFFLAFSSPQGREDVLGLALPSGFLVVLALLGLFLFRSSIMTAFKEPRYVIRIYPKMKRQK